MCGIAFILNYNPKLKIPKGLIKHLFIEMELRGTDASGFYLERENKKGEIERLAKKTPKPSTELWMETQETPKLSKDDKRYKFTGWEKLILLHTRTKTVGDPIDNENNHPVFSDNYVLVHNGQIYSSRLAHYKYEGKVDSEEILAYMETFGMVDGLKKLNGDMSVIFKKIGGNSLFLYRNSNPLDLVFFPQSNLLIGVSNESFVDIEWIHKTIQNKIFAPYFIHEELPPNSLYELSMDEKKFSLLEHFQVASTLSGKTRVWRQGDWVYE